MDNREILQKSIDYIEENIKTDIQPIELANMSGFSLFHYYRLFNNTIGMPVMQYIIKRKLINAIYDISQGQKMIDVALQYGFMTHAGFFKAFRKEYNCSPSTFLKKYKAKKPYQINLYKEEHIMITHKMINKVLNNWNLKDQKISNIYYEGTSNQNERAYYIGDKYVIKFTTNVGILKKHIQISKALYKLGFKAATPVLTIDGAEYLQYGELYCLLANKIEGNALKSIEIYNNQHIGRYIGEIIGQLHLVLKEFDDIALEENNILDKVKKWALNASKDRLDLSVSFCNNYLTTFENLYSSLPRQIIHRDLNPSNIVITNDKHVGFIDFELSEINIRIFDPCYTATAILSETFELNDYDKLDKWTEIYKNIIYGYDSISKLSDLEKEAIPYIIIANQLICVAWFIEQEKYQELAEININITKWLIDNFDRLNIY